MSLNHILTESKIVDRINAEFKTLSCQNALTIAAVPVFMSEYGAIQNNQALEQKAWVAMPVSQPFNPQPPVVNPVLSPLTTIPMGTFQLQVGAAGTYVIKASLSAYFTAGGMPIALYIARNGVDLGPFAACMNVNNNYKDLSLVTIAQLIGNDIISIRILYNMASDFRYNGVSLSLEQLS